MSDKISANLAYEKELIKLSNTYLREEPVLENPKERYVYQTSSLGGCDGTVLYYRYFETLEAAVLDAVTDYWNDSFKLSRIKLNVAGEIKPIEWGKRIEIGKYFWPRYGKRPEVDYDSLPTMKSLLNSLENVEHVEEKEQVKQMVKKM